MNAGARKKDRAVLWPLRCGLAAAWLAGILTAGCAPAATATGSRGERVEEAVATRGGERVAGRKAGGPAASPLPGDARAVHGTIDPATGERTARPAVDEQLREPRRTEIQTGRLRQAGEEYQPEAGELPYGYRIQVLAVPDFATASRLATDVKELLGGRLPVYLEFIDPYYKVRVGDFATQEEAQPALAQVRELGYRDAWAVRTTVKQAGP
jgi:hypothetical protein